MNRTELKDLWVGDWLTVTLTGAKGKFGGMQDDKAIVVLRGHRQLIEPKYLELAEESEEEESTADLLGLEAETKPEELKTPISNTLDLHLDKLSGYSADSGQTILDYQLKECRAFLQEITKRKIGSAIIIHGKGEGVLKNEVIHLLGDFPEIRHYHPRNQGGALELLLYY